MPAAFIFYYQSFAKYIRLKLEGYDARDVWAGKAAGFISQLAFIFANNKNAIGIPAKGELF